MNEDYVGMPGTHSTQMFGSSSGSDHEPRPDSDAATLATNANAATTVSFIRDVPRCRRQPFGAAAPWKSSTTPDEPENRWLVPRL